MSRPIATTLLIIALAALPSIADAAPPPPPPCTQADVKPTTLARHIPVNLPGFSYTYVNALPSNIRLFAKTAGGPSGDTEIPLTLGPAINNVLKVTPKNPDALTPGVSYDLIYDALFCAAGGGPPITPAGAPISFIATEAAPLPTKIGVLSGEPSVTLAKAGTTQYTITAAIALSAEMKPWAEAYEFSLLVDGNKGGGTGPIAASDDAGVGDAGVVAGVDDDGVLHLQSIGWCELNNASTKRHSIQLRARLPFTTTLGTTLTQDMEFDCPAPTPSVTPPNVVPTPTTPPPRGATPTSAIPTNDKGGLSCGLVRPAAMNGGGGAAAAAALLIMMMFVRRRSALGASAASRRT